MTLPRPAFHQPTRGGKKRPGQAGIQCWDYPLPRRGPSDAYRSIMATAQLTGGVHTRVRFVALFLARSVAHVVFHAWLPHCLPLAKAFFVIVLQPTKRPPWVSNT